MMAKIQFFGANDNMPVNKNRISSAGGLQFNFFQHAKPNTKLRFAIRDSKQFDLKNNPGEDFNDDEQEP